MTDKPRRTPSHLQGAPPIFVALAEPMAAPPKPSPTSTGRPVNASAIPAVLAAVPVEQKPKTWMQEFMGGPPPLQPGMPARNYTNSADYNKPGIVKTFMAWAWPSIIKDGPLHAATLYDRAHNWREGQHGMLVSVTINLYAKGYESREAAADAILMAVAQAGWLVPADGGPIRPGAVYTASGELGFEWFDPWRDPPK